MMLAAFFLPGWSVFGRLFLAALIQACISTLIIGINVPVEYYLTQRDLIGLVLLIGATCMTAAVLLSHGFEFGEVLFKKKWRAASCRCRRTRPSSSPSCLTWPATTSRPRW